MKGEVTIGWNHCTRLGSPVLLVTSQSQQLGKYLGRPWLSTTQQRNWRLGRESNLSQGHRARPKNTVAPIVSYIFLRLCFLSFLLHLKCSFYTDLVPGRDWTSEEAVLPFITLHTVPERNYSRWGRCIYNMSWSRGCNKEGKKDGEEKGREQEWGFIKETELRLIEKHIIGGNF